MEEYDVLIVGAGAAGLVAASELGKAGMKVCVLEGRDRTGGRIWALPGFSGITEGGAEFIHGRLPLTIKLLNEAGIPFRHTGGRLWHCRQGRLSQEEEFISDWPAVVKALQGLSEDMTVEEFLSSHFPGDSYSGLRRSVCGFVEGYDSAEPRRASAFSLRDELLSEETGENFRPAGGYTALISYLETKSRSFGGEIHLSTIVQRVNWKPGVVEAVTAGHRVFRGKKILITIPLGVLLAAEGSLGTISFYPVPEAKMKAAGNLGYGSVIKILLEFRESFWEQMKPVPLKELGFLFSDAPVPTWWSQYPEKTPLLTGWIAGPKTEAYKNLPAEAVLEEALASLSGIFNISSEEIRSRLVHHRVINWTSDPFTRGAYSYATPYTNGALKVMNEPEADTVFFAGEALYEGHETGTVEAALATGIRMSEKILNLPG